MAGRRGRLMPAGRLCFVIPVAANEAAMATDTLTALRRYYPNDDICLRLDAADGPAFDGLRAAASELRVDYSSNGESLGFHQLGNTICRLLQHAMPKAHKYDFVIKIDTDTLMLRSGLHALLHERAAAHGDGMIGPFRYGPSGSRRAFGPTARRQLLALLPIGLDKRRRLRLGWPPSTPQVLRALRRGYGLGEHVLGALYALSRATLIALDSAGALQDRPRQDRALSSEDDVNLSVDVVSVGHALIDINPPGEARTWLQYRSPFPIGPEEMLACGVIAVHPIKEAPGQGLREVFRRARDAA